MHLNTKIQPLTMSKTHTAWPAVDVYLYHFSKAKYHTGIKQRRQGVK